MVTAIWLFLLPLKTKDFRPLFQLVAVMGPLIALYYCSRRFEYSADREAIEFTDDSETAIRALAKLHQVRELPAASDVFTELFMTHPTFAHRLSAVLNTSPISTNHLTCIL